eukprot:CAMPEP_0204642906 /NCGR_PEP_ID=MMETSP0718-20130828/245_1 /ASSEMBLY_ACC=CAM_ASM_000674 /TAXON_ID=230516 /ORGANISM="Chaetoceros curvisetus" /LENGTH=239 /DNA_ID=CAMNT_0051663839 /DNA_START=33 /DNA_END=752 /DNA_ORIENTATION=-
MTRKQVDDKMEVFPPPRHTLRQIQTTREVLDNTSMTRKHVDDKMKVFTPLSLRQIQTTREVLDPIKKNTTPRHDILSLRHVQSNGTMLHPNYFDDLDKLAPRKDIGKNHVEHRKFVPKREILVEPFNQPPNSPLVAQDPRKLTNKDILLGRGTGPNSHPGNKKFRELIQESKSRYRTLPLRGKSKKNYVLKLLKQIADCGGRFMREDVLSATYYEVPQIEARKKIAQCLRDYKRRVKSI